MTLALRFAARSHTGLLRTLNEDSVYAGPRLLAVADGMGGHAAGEVASAVAIAALAPLDEDTPGTDLLAALRTAAESANAQLAAMVADDQRLQGMGTTLVAVLFAGSRLGLLHVGDSRAYLLRDGQLAQITHDHTLVQALVDEGRIGSSEASSHPQRSMITRAVDGRPDMEPDLSVREVRLGDRYLLCSDGLTGPVGSLDTLLEALSAADPQHAVDTLVQLALKGGGPDNVSVIVADAVDTADPPLEPVVEGAAADRQVLDGAGGQADGLPGDPAAGVAAGPNASRHGRPGPLLIIAALLLVVAAVAGGGWVWLRTQYFVGLDGTSVAVFRGVKGGVAGLSLAQVAERTDLASDGLSTLDRDRLARGIVAANRSDAERIVTRLEDQPAGGCPLPTAGAGPASPAPVAGRSPSAAPVPSARPPALPTPGAPAPGTAGSGTPGPGTNGTASSATPNSGTNSSGSGSGSGSGSNSSGTSGGPGACPAPG